MNRLVVFLLTILCFVSCGPIEGRETPVFLRSYIICYINGPFDACHFDWQGQHYIQLQVNDYTSSYFAPELGSTGEEVARFLELAERNGDRSYNREDVYDGYVGRNCLVDNFTEVHVVCLNRD